MALTVTVTDRVAHLGPVQQAVQGLGDTAIGQLVLDGKKFDTRFDGSVIADGPMTRSIDTASSLAFTVSDPERYLLQGKYFERRADLLFDDLWFRMCAMDKNGDQFTMTFEDREVALLSRHKKARRASRAKVTRAEFLRSLVREEPHISFVCPELHTRQKIASVSKADQVTQQKADAAQRKRGLAAREKIKIQGVAATPAQIRTLNQILGVAVDKKATELATLAMLVAAIGESRVLPSAVNGTHKGVFQSNQIPASDVTGQASSFLSGGRSFKAGGAIGLAFAHPDWSPGTIASATEISDQAGDYYDRFVTEAKAIYKAFGGTGQLQDSDTGGGTYFQRYEYTRGEPGGQKGEDTWTCGQRLADDVGWRWFCVAGVVYFISDYDLIRSMPRMTLNETSPGVDNIDFSLDDSAKIPDTVTITGRASRWAAPPGTVVTLDQSMADAAGAWIVTEIERPSLSNNDVTITLTKPKPPHLEPAPQVATRAVSASTTADGGANAGDLPLSVGGTLKARTAIGKAYAKAKDIDAKKYPYIWGGGHSSFQPSGNSNPGPTGFGIGYDCSGVVSAIMAAGDLLGSSTPLTTIGFLNWGLPGEGQYITVWVNQEHMFMEFKLPGTHVYMEAHRTGTIVAFESSRNTSGFTARHAGGT